MNLIRSQFLISILVMACFFIVSGCAHQKAYIVPITNSDFAAPDAEDIVRILRYCNFSNEQIIELGKDLRNTLAKSGAAQIRVNEKTVAIFSVHDSDIYICTSQKGSFIYDLNTGEIK